MKSIKALSGLVLITAALISCSSPEVVEEGPKNPTVTLGVSPMSFQEALESSGSFQGIGTQENLLVLSGCRKRAIDSTSRSTLKGLLKALDEHTRGQVLIGCWKPESTRLKLIRAAGFLPRWKPSTCGTVEKVDENQKKWVYPEHVDNEGLKCGYGKTDGVILVLKGKLGELGVLEGLSGIASIQSQKQIKTVADLLQMRQMLPPIKLVVWVDQRERVLAVSKSPLAIEIFARKMTTRTGSVWFHPTVKALARWQNWELSEPLLKMNLSDQFGPEQFAELQVVQLGLESPMQFRGVPLESSREQKK